jgi:hypothetical protein
MWRGLVWFGVRQVLGHPQSQWGGINIFGAYLIHTELCLWSHFIPSKIETSLWLDVCTCTISTLIKVKMFANIIFPILLVTLGLIGISNYRRDNFGCGHDVPDQSNTTRARTTLAISSVLIVTYALELLVFPAMMVNEVIRCLRSHHLFDSSRGKAVRFEFKFGLFLKFLQ